MPAVEVIAGGACAMGFVPNWKNPIFGVLPLLWAAGCWTSIKPIGAEESLFRPMNSLFAAKNSVFPADQGIRLQRIEVARELPVLHGTGSSRQHTEITFGIGAGKAPNWPPNRRIPC